LIELWGNNNPLTEVRVGWTIPLTVDSKAFENVDVANCTLRVPVGSKALYQVAPVWKDFGTILEEGETVNQAVYHAADKAALRAFLSQASASAGQTNGQRLGLTPADTIDWRTEEGWVNKVGGLTWNQATPKKISLIRWGNKSLGGNLNLSGCTALTSLDCDSNQLVALNVSANTALTHLNTNYNPLTSLNVSSNTALIDLWCTDNPLTTLDVSANTALTGLLSNNNQLTSLDISRNTALTILSCSGNQLTSLDISANTALTRLWCTYNQLSTLDVSANTALIELWGNNNPLTEVSVGWTSPITVDSKAFENVDVAHCTLRVPVGSKALYQVAPVWKDFGTILEAGETGIQAIPPSFEVYVSDGTVYINSSVAEQIEVYSIGGALLYRATKPAGATTINATRFLQGVLIIKGGSGWVKKVLI
jgi:hypothetical protein